jgi:2,3-bisphosphoglycerate-independent phosphoglycerate mutase
MNKKPYIFIIRDGWGYSERKEYNAVYQCNPINHLSYIKNYPTTLIEASGIHVGLPEGNQGSSEVGHLNIGAGRIVYQNLVRISKDIDEHKFSSRKAIIEAIEHFKKYNSNIHLYGLVQDQGVHAHTKHLIGYLQAFKDANVPSNKIFIHMLSDGRDTAPQSAKDYAKSLESWIDQNNYGKIVSVTGRYYAMDRDNRWDRVKLFYDLLFYGKSLSPVFNDVYEAIDDAYNKGEVDEFIKPRMINGFKTVEDNDIIVFFNYRFDRAREITKAIVESDFDIFETRNIKNLFYLATTEYYDTIKQAKKAHVEVAYPLEIMTNLMGQVISDNNLVQLRIAETEKFAHVTFFFNGQQDIIYKNEERILVDSPKVPTYDLQPEMSAYEVKTKMIEALNSDRYDFIVLNFANPDMVGHTGVFEAAVKACKVVDECIGEIVELALLKDGVVFLFSDHGNAETMQDPVTHEPYTAHTSNPVWLTIISKRKELQKDAIKLKEGGKLADISPTMLKIIGLTPPEEMDGLDLIEKI